MKTLKLTGLGCLVLLLAACGAPRDTAPRAVQQLGKSEGLVLEIDAKRQTASLLGPVKRKPRRDGEKASVLRPSEDIEVTKLEAEFDRKGGLALNLELKNITKDAVFNPPFAVQVRASADEHVRINVPKRSQERLGDRDKVSPSETASLQFDLTYERDTFLLYIDISAILTIIDPNTFTVNSAADLDDLNPGDGLCGFIFTWYGNSVHICTLRAAITEVNALPKFPTKTIKVPNGTYALTKGRLKVRNSMTIKGDGVGETIIDGGGATGIMQIGKYEGSESENDILVTIRDLTLQNGDTGISGAGGALRIEEHTYVQIFSCLIQNNEAGLAGGGIANSGILRVTECGVNSNKTSAAGFAASGGGGVANFGTGNVKLTRSTVSGNEAPWGGGISNGGKLDLLTTTLSGNKARRGGGGLLNDDGYVNISFSTITKNEANTDNDLLDAQDTGGGVRNNPGTGQINMANSILAGNTDNRVSVSGEEIYANHDLASPDCYSVTPYRFTSFRGNLVGILSDNCGLRDTIYGASLGFDQHGYFTSYVNGTHPLNPKLGVLTNNGGPTKTHKPYWNSPAVDKGTGVTSSPLSDCPDKDQRGEPRPVDGDSNGTAKCDVGALERQ